ncbi:hypothetical protein GCM10023090_02990 [Acidovorax lacteus]|uniref:histidine kinase n=1 Tax=Acidovorax lacteus TaxID=1924988 RepID=A0ABP8KXG5_9BURK
MAWVLDELRKSLDGAVKALRRFVRDAEIARESDIASLDAGPLRIARQQLHQASGALEMVGMGPPALLLRSMEAAVQKYVQRPEQCSDQAAAVIERASFALIEFLESVLAGKPVSPVSLFPQYRDAQALTGAERVHPADLWPVERRFREPATVASAAPLPYGAEARARLDAAVLKIVKTGDAKAARSLRDTCHGFVAAQTDRQARAFWKICAGFFEAVAHKQLAPDVYVKRVASRVLLQYATLAKGDPAVADRLVQDLLFFCSQARPSDPDKLPALQAVRQAFALDRFQPVDYETARFGRFDPALLAQARKRIAAATETWSALAGGDRNKVKPASDQFSLVCDSLRKLHPGSEPLAAALGRAVESVVRTGEPPSPALAMEVATSVLYLQAAFEELDAADEQMAVRASRLAERLDAVGGGAEPEPLEPWMEELYRRVSDNQTMGSVVDELRSTLGEVEKALDQFFRSPTDVAPLAPVPGHLAQMRGVLSVLGLDQASLAVVRMRDTVDRLLVNAVEEAERQPLFEKLGNSLGALGFLIDMLSYQRTMARKLFVYDEELGELRILTGRARGRASDQAEEVPAKLEERAPLPLPDVVPRFPVEEPISAPTDFALLDMLPEPAASPAPDLAPEIHFDAAPQPAPEPAAQAAEPAVPAAPAAPVAAPAVPVAAEAEVEDELLEIFLEEAREVVGNGLGAIASLETEPGNLGEQTTLRRAFHTLKGSSRMVGLNDFGEAAWSMEQVLNAWLAEQKPVQPPLLALSTQALQSFARWADDIAAGQAGAWDPQMFRRSADVMRLEGRFLPLGDAPGESVDQPPVALPDAGAPAVALAEPGPVAESLETPPLVLDAEDADALAHVDFASTEIGEERPAEPVVAEALAPVAEDIDFSVFEAAVQADAQAAAAAAGAAPDANAIDLELPDLMLPAEPDALAVAPDTAAPQVPAVDAIELPSLDLPDDAVTPVAVGAGEDAQALDLLPDLPLGDAAPAAVVHTEEPVLPAVVDDAVDLGQALLPESTESLGDAEVAPEAIAAESPDALPDAVPAAQSATDDALAADDVADASAEPAASAAGAEASGDEAVKVIESLRIGIPLYNVYLNEADEWSRRLATCLQEWALELHEPLPDTAVALAHSLAGSSATVGFSALSELSRLLEHALQHVQLQSRGTEVQARVFLEASEDIRRLLHQFAAGFLKEPQPAVLEALREVLATEVDSGLSALADESVRAVLPFEAEEALLATAESLPAEAEPEAEPEPQAAAPAVVPGYVAPALSARDAAERDADQRVDDAIAHAVALASDVDDDIDAIDVIDPDLFPIFEEEAAELLPRLGGALRQWSANPDHDASRTEVLRALHTLKGSSRLAGAMRLGEMAHRLESAIEQLDPEAVTSEQIDPLLVSLDALQASFDALRAIGEQGSADAPVVLAPAAVTPSAAAEPPSSADASAATAARVAPAAPLARPVGATQLQPVRAAANQSVRVRAQLLDRLVNQAGEVLISRSRLDVRLSQLRSSLQDLSGNLDRLRQQLRDVEVQAETQMQSRLAQSKDSAVGFDPLEFDRFTRVQELTRMMAESVNDVATVQRNLQRAMEGAEDDLIAQGRQARELQRDLLRTRMLEFEGIAERLYAVVRQASKETGKQIKLDITGGSIEMDRGVLDRMTPAFEHLLRNCVAHGIEAPESRTAAGKPAVGTITVALRQEGNDVSVEFRDDGVGLNLARIRDKAVAQGLIAPDALLSTAEAANLIFMPGFSTATEVTGLAGRGIGMDVVRSEVNALGGRIETTTEPGQGTSFRMVLPLTTAVTQVVMLRAGDLTIGVPANVVEIVRRTSVPDLEQAYRSGSFDDGLEPLPFFWAGALLQASTRSIEAGNKTRPVVVFRSAAQRIAMHVDEVLGNQEVVVKNLGPQLSRLPGLAGMSVLASGAVVLIYNPVALATVYGDQVRSASVGLPAVIEAETPAAARAAGALPSTLTAAQQVPLVLVVDDSITVRRVTQRLLQREGYRVAMAADGLQALERLQEERPTVVLSDIEMPRMDGFDLARNIRADAALRDLPIIMITSRIAEKHREHAMELGVNHYLGKPYSDEELLSLIQHYARKEAEAGAEATSAA